MENKRELILDMLIEILEKENYSHLVIRDVLDKYNYMESRDKAFIKRVTEGTLERLIQMDYILDQFSKTPVAKMKPLIRNLLRMSTYQMLYMDSIPDSAVCNEAVKLAGKRGFKGLAGFVNGVLRSIARNKTKITYPDREKEKSRFLSVWYSMPEWLVKMWMDAYGEKTTSCILEGLLKEHPVSVRVKENLSSKQREEWIAQIRRTSVIVNPHPYLPYAFQLSNIDGIKNLRGYEEGYFIVQDVSSMLVTEVCKIGEAEQAGMDAAKEQITGDIPFLGLDVCAAPGGKSMHLAEKLTGKGKVISRDLTEYKVSLIRDNIERMGYQNIDASVGDALVFDEDLKEKADVVLADLPCSGLGIIGKKRDIKYRISKEGLEELKELQKQILNVIWQYVKPGGVLIYSTCTINSGENQQMVEWFTQNYPFRPESLSPYLPEVLKKEGENGMLQLLPGVHETDGFFLAKLRRLG